mmetsp:Transcript_14093/g.21409  ORF Transcript_14093/g.21409 Transcript_14093/m.21409 type:complete len:157 (+) Transcript_14093:574-1044(+)
MKLALIRGLQQQCQMSLLFQTSMSRTEKCKFSSGIMQLVPQLVQKIMMVSLSPIAATSFNIEDSENEPALAFFSRYNVNYVKIPELASEMFAATQLMIQIKYAHIPRLPLLRKQELYTCSAISNETRSPLQAGIDGWNTSLGIADDPSIFLKCLLF